MTDRSKLLALAEADPALVERMTELARGVAGCYPVDGRAQGVGSIWINLAREIVAELPEPIDPDLIEARKIAQQSRIARDDYSFEQGRSDTHPLVICALAAIKRGRELAQAEALS